MNDEKTDSNDNDFQKIVGERLRKVRKRKRLSLQAVEEKSGGALRAAVIGSYERGDRAATVRKLAEIADFYGVPVDSLVSSRDHVPSSDANDDGKVVLDLDALRAAPDEAKHLVKFVAGVQEKRGDFGGSVLTIRGNDVWMVSSVYGWSPTELREKMASWGVIVGQD
ncbi:transcriptional regulator [Phytoactinopolyspora alkaliphila]|uniref:Transcriptional regulator n=1 Tax=Phytoactinopolyspora alkaliphila TaxID=1783498 RepID=A0A6N9YT90_9ACTN|nr:transcriptional regulator [Phytoactinopolyspora alkaliphila]NED98184.1 transcriptional regulator [Phytoactinopolyspora alkaliphila]